MGELSESAARSRFVRDYKPEHPGTTPLDWFVGGEGQLGVVIRDHDALAFAFLIYRRVGDDAYELEQRSASLSERTVAANRLLAAMAGVALAA